MYSEQSKAHHFLLSTVWGLVLIVLLLAAIGSMMQEDYESARAQECFAHDQYYDRLADRCTELKPSEGE